MTKLATITPINCITNEQDGDIFEVYFDADAQAIIARFEDGREEMLEERAETMAEAVDAVYALYSPSIAFIYEPEEVDV